MANFEDTTSRSGNIGFMDRGIRIGLGLAAIFTTLQLSMNGGDAYPLVKLIATIVVLTGIAGWDPLYAVYRHIISRMTTGEVMMFSTGNITMPDRTLRIGLGLAVLIFSLQGPIVMGEAYPFVKILATLVVLTGIAGWDPLYAAFRRIVLSLKNIEKYRYLALPHYN